MDNKGKSHRHDDIIQILAEFLEVAINSIVFLKGIYPSGAFERCRYMNVPVQKARHPELHDYIHCAVTCLHPFLSKGLVERVLVIFYGKDRMPAEKFVFKLSLNQSPYMDVEATGLEFALRSFLIKLSVAEAVTRSLPADCQWEIAAYFRSLPCADNDTKEAKMWIPTDTKHWQHLPAITPIKSMNSEPLSLQLYLEHPQSPE